MAKRCFDILLAMIGLIFSAPLWIFIALRIWLEDRGPVFFNQLRTGKNGRLFRAYKFRTMRTGNGQEMYQAAEDDPRITRFGKRLRTTALDELPQLLNILKGDMSFVGPRPLMPSEIDLNPSKHEESYLQQLFQKRSAVVPGLTGIAQVFAPRDASRAKKFRYDLLYIRNRSFFLDLRLILLSFLITFMGNWENRRRKLPAKKRELNV